MGAINQITNSISSALGTSGSGGGLLGGVESLVSNPIVDVAAAGAADYFSGGALSGALGGALGGGASAADAAAGGLGVPAAASGATSAAGDFGLNSVVADTGLGGGPIGSELGAAYNQVGAGTPAASGAGGLNGLLSGIGGTAGLKTGLQLGTDLYSISAGQNLQNAAQQNAQTSAAVNDPMAAQRQQYAQQLAALQANPGQITNTPGYQAGIDAMQRQLAAQGLGSSTTGQAQIASYGQNFYNQQIQQLAGLATPPAAAIQGNTAANTTSLQAQSLANKADTSALSNIISML